MIFKDLNATADPPHQRVNPVLCHMGRFIDEAPLVSDP